MELMSVVLLCAFVQLPLALGIRFESDDIQVKKWSSILNERSIDKSDSDNWTKKLNAFLKSIPTQRPLLPDDLCKNCTSCMKKALDTNKSYKHSFENLHPGNEETQSNKKIKRSVLSNFNYTDTVEDSELKKIKVTKYKTADDKVYAIKVNEIKYNQVSNNNDAKSTCKVYSVKKAFPCESEESNLILMKKKVNKKRISKQKNTSTSTEKSIPPITSVLYKKRKLREESSHVWESFMPSIEELY